MRWMVSNVVCHRDAKDNIYPRKRSRRTRSTACGIAFGNSYAEIVRDGAGRVTQLWPLSPAPRAAPPRPEDLGALLRVHQPDGELVRLEQRDVFHLRGPGLHGLMGDNIVARAAKSLAVAAAQERTRRASSARARTPAACSPRPGTSATAARAAEERLGREEEGPRERPQADDPRERVEVGGE
jgi:hypothetical protein